MPAPIYSSKRKYPLTLKPSIQQTDNPRLYDDIFRIQNTIRMLLEDLEGVLGAYIPEAPVDGNLYGRQDATWHPIPPPGTATWGNIVGHLTDQLDLVSALATKEPTISAGTAAQYWRGDKNWATLNLAAVDGFSAYGRAWAATTNAITAKQLLELPLYTPAYKSSGTLVKLPLDTNYTLAATTLSGSTLKIEVAING